MRRPFSLTLLVVCVALGSSSLLHAQQAKPISYEDLVSRLETVESELTTIHEADAQNASLQQSVDALINQSATDANGHIQYECCAEPTWLFEAGYINWRARRSRVPFSGRIRNLGGMQNNLPVDDDSYEVGLTETSFGKDSGYRVAVGRRNSEQWDMMFRYTNFSTFGGKAVGASPVTVDTDDVYANLIDRSLADEQIDNGDFDDGLCEFASESIDLRYDTYDLEFGKQFTTTNISARGFGGFRFGEISQSAYTAYVNLEGDDLDTYTLESNTDMHAWGFRAGGELNHCLGNSGISLFGRGAFSMMLAEFDVRRKDVAFDADRDPNGDLEIRQYRHDYYSVVPVAELAAGLLYERGSWSIKAGYEFSNWFNLYQHLNMVGWDDVDGDDTVPVSIDRGDLSFDGWFVDAGYSY